MAFAPDCAHRARKFPLFLIARVINSARSDGNPDAAQCVLLAVAHPVVSREGEGILSSICDATDTIDMERF